ncbi:MAG: hypothetical protein ACNFW9_01330 [Candidatus Kerfeldbacteria bacterium]|jgi:hypothetical protein
MHRFKIKTSPTSRGEWKATAMKGHKEVAVSYGISRQKAIDEVIKKMPEDKRFKTTTGRTPNGAGCFATVKDYQTGESWTGNHSYDTGTALKEIEPLLPKEYFFQKNGSEYRMNGRNEWASHHGWKAFGIPVIIMCVIVVIIMVLIGNLP